MRAAAGAVFAAAFLAYSSPLAAAYDDAWYQASFWGGEYPNGFSVNGVTIVGARFEPDPETPASIECLLPKGAVYHPWNHDRVEADLLTFVSFTRKQPYTLDADLSLTVYTEEGDDVGLDLTAGDTWTYLTYLGEGAFLMEYAGATYVGDQVLFEVSSANGEAETHEWLRLICGNGESGWLLLDEILPLPTIGEANIVGYGEARDLGK
jgi:hypothetical protein